MAIASGSGRARMPHRQPLPSPAVPGVSHRRKLKRGIKRLVSAISDRVGSIRVLFLVTNEIGFANQAPLLQALARDDAFSVATFVQDDDVSSYQPAYADLLDRHKVGALRARITPWHYIITTDTLEFWPLWNALGVSIEHGSCIGNIGYQPDRDIWALRILTAPNIAMAFVPGHAHLALLGERHPQFRHAPDKAYFVSGVAKLAELPRLAERRAELLEAIGLDPARRTVLVSSHWTEMSLLKDLGLNLIEWLAHRDEDLNILVTAHPKLWASASSTFDPHAFRCALEALCRHNPRVRLVATGMPVELLAASDLLICDHSSIRVEFAMLGRPAVLYRNPSFICESAMTDQLYRDASWVFGDLSELPVVFDDLARAPGSRSHASKRLQETFLADPSRTVEIIHSTLRSAGRVSTTASRRWDRVKALEQALAQR